MINDIEKLAVPTNEDDFRTLIEDGCYYVDKTLLIKEFVDQKGTKVTLITRPRRFGKTLNMTMMRDFFDISQDSKDIFKGTNIMNTEYKEMLNSKPVIYLTFKDCNGDDVWELLDSLKDIIYLEYDRYYETFINSKSLSKNSIEQFNEYANLLKSMNVSFDIIKRNLKKSIFILSKTIQEHYNIKPIVILDEYDNPFIEAKNGGYYDEAKGFLSSLFVSSFKGNANIEKTIMTGIQRIAHESIFSKFNNPDICTVVDDEYADKFGLTEDETTKYLEYFGFNLSQDVKDFYDGYKFIEDGIYNPMSITKYISKKGKLRSYWVNTSANTLIKKEIPNAGDLFLRDFDKLIENKSCEVNIDFATTFAEKQNAATLWGLLVNAGYVTAVESTLQSRYIISIPNEEVKFEFRRLVANVR